MEAENIVDKKELKGLPIWACILLFIVVFLYLCCCIVH